jgi:hypothetical protein
LNLLFSGSSFVIFGHGTPSARDKQQHTPRFRRGGSFHETLALRGVSEKIAGGLQGTSPITAGCQR